jgi:hypothetical protein
LEDFAHKIYVLGLDGYEKCENDALEDITTEAVKEVFADPKITF